MATRKRPVNPVEDSVMDVVSALRGNADMLAVATDLTLLPSEDQRKLAQLCFNLIGLWAEWGETAGPSHPLYNEYVTSKRMVEGLFENLNSGGKHRNAS